MIGWVSIVDQPVNAQCKKEDQRDRSKGEAGEFQPILKHGKKCRGYYPHGSSHHESLVKLVAHPVQEKGVGGYLVCCQKDPP